MPTRKEPEITPNVHELATVALLGLLIRPDERMASDLDKSAMAQHAYLIAEAMLVEGRKRQ